MYYAVLGMIAKFEFTIEKFYSTIHMYGNIIDVSYLRPAWLVDI